MRNTTRSIVHRHLRLALLVGVAVPLLAACSMFGGDKPKPQMASAPGNPPRTKPECARLAPLADAEGNLARPAMDEQLDHDFAAWDTDKSGWLSAREVEPVNDKLRALNAGASPVMDWNGDGQINFIEYAAGWRTMFNLCDRSQDDIVTQAEMGSNTMREQRKRNPNLSPPPSQQQTSRPDGSSGTLGRY